MKKYILVFYKLLSFPQSLAFLLYVYCRYFLGLKSPPLNISKREFSIDKSFIRWGDGETMSCLGIPFAFSYDYEKSSRRLSKKMKNILKYSGDNIILGIAYEFLANEESVTPHIRAWIITRYLFQTKWFKNKHFDDAFYFRKIESYEKFLDMYRGKNIYLITNIKSIEKIRADGRLNLVGSYAIPSKNAFDVYDTTKESIIKQVEGIDTSNTVFILAGGPMAKVLAYELSIEKGYICHDTGQFFDLFLK